MFGSFQVTPVSEDSVQLDVELCRALFEKNPDRLLELVSQWLEENRLTLSDDFCVPAYLRQVMALADDPLRMHMPRRILVS